MAKTAAVVYQLNGSIDICLIYIIHKPIHIYYTDLLAANLTAHKHISKITNNHLTKTFLDQTNLHILSFTTKDFILRGVDSSQMII